MYDWRKMTPAQRQEALRERLNRHRPWHRPPHWSSDRKAIIVLTAACFEHSPIIGKDPSRLAECKSGLIELCQSFGSLDAWCVLPNHYHLLAQTEHLKELRTALGRFRGRSSYFWNGQDSARGRKVWHSDSDRWIRSERHYWTSVNYVHNNPVNTVM